MKKLLTLLMLLALAIPIWAGTQTITISRNDGQFETSTGVYYASKGGVTMTMSGGLNNKNYLVLRHENTITFKSANFAIKEIIFHCLDNYPSTNLDVFYWGPKTMNVMTVNYKPAGSTQTTPVTPGKYTASGYDGHWVSSFSGTWTSDFKNYGTRTHTSFANGYPAGNTLTFESMGKPIRFSSIDIIVEKEDGDIYDLVTSINQVQNNHNYLIVNWQYSQALSVNTKEGRKNEQVRTGSPVEFISGNVDGQYDQYAKVKTDGEAQIIKFEEHELPIITTSTTTRNEDRPWLLNAGGNYLRITSDAATGVTGNNGPDLYGVSSPHEMWSYAKIEIGSQNYGYNARIRFQQNGNSDYIRPTSTKYRVAYNRTNNYFRDLDYVVPSDGSGLSEDTRNKQNIRLYTPAQNYTVTTEVQPDASKGSISLRDGVIVNDASATSGTSQQYENVSFLVTPANGYKIKSLVIQALNPDGTVEETLEPTGSTHNTSGTLYTFTMPAYNVHIIATFEEVQYHNVYITVNPSGDYGNVFLTDGYVVQNDQVKSYEGANVVFNVTPNLIDIDDESKGYHELYSVTVTYYEGGEMISYTYTNGDYNFTMPDADVLITATFIYNNNNPLYLLGTANGGLWAPTGPRFNYDPQEQQYYIDVYFKGDSGDYGDYTGGNFPEVSNGHFNVVWGKWSTWAEVNSNGRRGIPYDYDYFISENNPNYGLVYDDWKADQGYAFKIPAGIYRIYVKSYGYHNDQLTIVKYPTALTMNPAGGATAVEAVQVGLHQEVILAGDVYDQIMAINPDELAANFKYKAVKTIDGSATADAPVQGTSSAVTTLDVVNDGETVTQLDGYNYLGWIVASNTGFYKVISTPLWWIEKNGEESETYTIADQLQGVYVPSHRPTSLWCKDLGNISIIKSTPADGMIDFLANHIASDNHLYPMRYNDWDQSNWVELDFSGYGETEGMRMASEGKNKLIKAATVTGEYTDDLNYKIKVTSGDLSVDGDATYSPNPYATVNFLEGNIGANGVTIGEGSNAKNYYFLNPKIQEYAVITYAMWDKNNQIFVIPDDNPFSGAFGLGTWELNEFDDQSSQLDGAYDVNPNVEYEFHAIIQRSSKAYGSPVAASQGAPALKAVSAKTGQEAWNVFTIVPLDLKADSKLPTAIHGVSTNAQVTSVEYVNLAGVRSSKPFSGVNIVVTHYNDGSFTTAKKVCK